MHIEREITDIHSLIEAIGATNARFAGQVWWRGQRNVTWGLSPSVSRNPNNAKSEQSLTARFKQKAPSRHPHVPAPDDLAGWLFLMQHYRLPTRLLDWTESPLIACFFASEVDPAIREHPGKIRDADGALFALSPYALNELHVHRRILLLPTDNPASALIRRAFQRSAPDSSDILAIRPSEVDPRLMVQLSVFTLHGSATPLEGLPSHDSFVVKYSLPAPHKHAIREQLKQLGIRESSVFPDLEHLARDVSSTRFREVETPGQGSASPSDEEVQFQIPSPDIPGEASS